MKRNYQIYIKKTIRKYLFPIPLKALHIQPPHFPNKIFRYSEAKQEEQPKLVSEIKYTLLEMMIVTYNVHTHIISNEVLCMWF